MKKKMLTIILLVILMTVSLEQVCANHQIKIFDESIDADTAFKNDLAFDLRIKLLMRIGCFPSLSVCIIKNNSVAWYNGYGRAKLLSKPTIDTVYPIGSISKTFVGTAMMQLYEQGLFDLDDNINDYLDFEIFNPNYPDVNITFRMLLAHQSSLVEKNIFAAINMLIKFLKFKDEYPYPLIKRMIHPNGDLYKLKYWGAYAPGSGSFYSNIHNFMLLEHLTEIISNQSFIDYCKENIFNPLNMSNTSFFFKDFKRSQLVTAYHNFGNFFFRIPYLDIPYGAGGIKCSIEDLSHYATAHMNGGVYNEVRILNESTVELMHSIQYEDSLFEGNGFGLGWIDFGEFYGMNLHGHTGRVPGGTSAIYINESNDFAILCLTNRYVFDTNRAIKTWASLVFALFNKAKEL
jgi:CubicO group peptidase (beta-lactamase class C family)